MAKDYTYTVLATITKVVGPTTRNKDMAHMYTHQVKSIQAIGMKEKDMV
jgi:hypothetical protein